ncbi:hypothetical protein V1514DRAFT_342944 [Lipomyces japonicus]|uniref:uncharacterized protein n=1 Tax=Lipomyces japonicus TaxID=56871 RepID=UPI0034CE14C8
MSGQEVTMLETDEPAVDQKNTLVSVDSPISVKYIAAGRIAHSVLTVLVSAINDDRKLINTYDICATGDALIEQETSKVFKNVQEKGVAGPTTVDVNNCIGGYSPLDRENAYVLNDGDVVKISLAVHIDGYTSLVSHTLIAFPNVKPINQVAPTTGSVADVICATHLATEAISNLLGTVLYQQLTRTGFYNDEPVNGDRIKKLVETVGNNFKVKVVPGSSVRRIKRFLVGQDTVHEVDVKGYAWGSLHVAAATDDPDEGDLKKDINTQEPAQVGETWLIDISFATYSGIESDLNKKNFNQLSRRTLKPHKDLRPTIIIRDYDEKLSMKLTSARGVLTEIDNRKSVFPIQINSLTTAGAPLGVAALITKKIVSPTQVMTIQGRPTAPVAARERTTVLLLPSVKYGGELVRLSGGQLKPSWVHSDFEITNDEVLDLLSETHAGVRTRNIQAVDITLEANSEPVEMEIE